MTTISVSDKYVEILSALGEVQPAIDLALQRYTIDQITTKISGLRQKDTKFQAMYGLDYPTFSHRIAQDEEFVSRVEATINKTWELDLADWEFCYKGIEDWTRTLQNILLI